MKISAKETSLGCREYHLLIPVWFPVL